ncbi:MAG TPA: hypothetical protein VLT83_01435 [Opitutaceae bacterium]|nr:hypothetical protein [Opitutaceae bacterium]
MTKVPSGNIYDQSFSGLVTSTLVSGLPTDGSMIYVQLFTQLGATWLEADYNYTAISPNVKAAMTSPVPGATLSGQSVNFAWTAGASSGVIGFMLQVGTTQGASDLFVMPPALVTSQAVTGLPTNSSTVYVRLWTQVGPSWLSNDYTYTAAGSSYPAAITSPAPGSTLGSSSGTFSWSAGSGASAYRLQVGTTQGAGDILDQNFASSANSTTATGIQLNGATIYARLWTLLGTTWQYADYTYPTLNVGSLAALTSPALSKPLSGASVTFTWNAVSGATAYKLEVGTAPGGNDVFGQSVGLATSQAVGKIPTDGSTICVRLTTTVPGAGGSGYALYNDYTYTAAGGSAKAVMTSPAGGTTSGNSSVTFKWNPGASASSYQLDVGTAHGKIDLFSQDVGLATSQTVAGLPNDGSTIYVRLWTKEGPPLHVTSDFNDYTYSCGSTKAVLTSPAPGTVLPLMMVNGASITFSWYPGAGASSYQLDVGTAQGQNSLFSQNVGLATSQTVSGLPTDASTLYVRLWTIQGTKPNFTSQFNDYTYPLMGKAVMTTPAPGAMLGGASVTFSWTAAPGASQGTRYELDVGTAQGQGNLFSQDVGLATSQTVSGIPTDGSTVYVNLGTFLPISLGTWVSNQYTYTAGGALGTVKSGATLQQGATTPVTPAVVSATAGQTSGTTTGTGTFPTIAPVSRGSATQPTSLVPLQPAVATAPATTPVVSPVVSPVLAKGTVAPAPTATLPIAAATAGQTAAALANFPVLSGAVRTWFSSTRSKLTWQERANFTAAVAPENAVSPYAQQIAGAGWDEVSRSESGDAATGTHQFTLDYRNGQTSAHVILAQNTKQGTNLTVTLTTQFPGSSAPSLSAGTTAAPATGAASSAVDRGARDPADFPRLAGSIRTWFTSTSQKTSSQEVATYTAKCSPAAADAFYAQNLPGAGWDELMRHEDVNDATKSDQFSTKWQNAARSAVIALNGSTAGGCDVRVAITTQTAGTP